MGFLSTIGNFGLKLTKKIVGGLLGKRTDVDVKILWVGIINLLFAKVMAKENTFVNPPYKSDHDRCPPEDEIYLSHHIVTNVPKLQDAKIVVYLETHNEIQQRLHEQNVFKILRTKKGARDTILIEGFSQDTIPPCDSVVTCYYPEHDGLIPKALVTYVNGPDKNKTETNERICGHEFNVQVPKSPLFFAFRMPKKFKCQGWDTEEYMRYSLEYDTQLQKDLALEKETLAVVNKIREIGRIYSITNRVDATIRKELKSYIKQFLLIVKEREHLLSEQLKVDLVLLENSIKNGYRKNFSKINERQIKWVNGLQDEMLNKIADKLKTNFQKGGKLNVIKRNKEMIRSIKGLMKDKGKVFLSPGKSHIITDEEERMIEETGQLSPAKFGTEQHEIRRYLSNKPHAYLLPKKNQKNELEFEIKYSKMRSPSNP